MKRKSVVVFLLLFFGIGWYGNIPTAQCSKSPNSPQAFPHPPLIYSTSHILELRDQLRRVGWTENTLDAQIAKSDAPEIQLWNLTVKAALLGGNERFKNVVEAWTPILTAPEINRAYPLRPTLMRLRAYDALTALPEFNQLNPTKKAELPQKFSEYFSSFLVTPTPNAPSMQSLHDLSAKLLAGMLVDATPTVAVWIQGSTANLSWRDTLLHAAPGEGLMPETLFPEQMEITIDLLYTAKALQTWNRAEFDSHAPQIKKFVDVMVELLYPNGTPPSVLANQSISQNELVDLLEVGSAVFGDPKYLRLLNTIYKTTVRRGENLLLGSLIPDLFPPKLFRSLALPRSGMALLHQTDAAVPLTVKLNTGLTPKTGAAALLAVDFLSEHNAFSSWESNLDAAGFNTVYVDRAPHNLWSETSKSPANALVMALNTFPDGETYAVAGASGQQGERPAYDAEAFNSTNPKVPYYQRLLFMVSPYVIDLFRVSGGRMHDFVYHGTGKFQTRPAGDWQSIKSTPEEYALINRLSSPAQISPQKGVYAAVWGSSNADAVSERLWFIDPVGSDLILGETANHPFLIARRAVSENEGDLYACIHEVFSGKTPPKTRLERLTLDPRPNERNFQAHAFVVERDDVSDIFLFAIQPDILYSTEYRQGKLTFQGTFGHIRWLKDRFQTLQLVGGTQLHYGKYGVALEKSLMVGSVQNVNSASGALEIQFPYRFPGSTAMTGNLLMLMSETATPRLQPFGIQEVLTGDSGQTVLLQNAPNLIDPPPSLGAPVHVGDQVLYETVAELKRLEENQYSFFASAPADVTVETDEENHRVFLKQTNTLLHRLRGNDKDGAITFHVDPQECVDGRIGFTRMP